jgi:hypothetical protein
VDYNSQSPFSGDPFTAPFSESANSSAQTLPPTGPNPVVIKTTSEIRAQRLEKKIQKLTQQRDYWKSEYEKLSYILRMFPYSTAEERHEERRIRGIERNRAKELEVTQKLLLAENESLKKQIEALQKVTEANQYPF